MAEEIRGFVRFLDFISFFGPSPSVANRLPSWKEWTNQRPSSMNIHESEIQTFERVCLGPQHHTKDFSQGQTAFSYEWKEKKSVRLKLGLILHRDHRRKTTKARQGEPPEEMTMTTIPEGLNSPSSGKAVFMEFGPPSQQMSPSSMSHGHYPMHCLHSAGHTQHDSYSPGSSFPRSLGYPYVNSVGSHSTSPYLSTVQPYQNSSALAQTRLEDTGEDLVSEQAVQIQETDEAGRRHDRRQRIGHWPWTFERLSLGGTGVELADHREDVGGHYRILHSQLHLMVSNHTPRVYATVTAHVNTDLSPLLCSRLACQEGDGDGGD
ncbi:hypothetical protein F2P81_021105 [Scophthalmus maximus]|uniref:Uncharacterized protein n=1 Tax=Scophthalmus maximus TaxID=52904 RepID=A0A6A4S2H6_SCOMX|nr:hypothetical protein F2P81_021105 [Scophthalmus maximus]